MGIGSSGVVNCANTFLGTANYTVADGYVADRTVIVDGNGPAQLNLNFARGEVLDPRITFSRTSNATRVNAQGLIEYAPHNLLTYSEQFDNAVWVKGTGVTVTPNTTASPDGTTTADLITSPQDQGCYENLLSVGTGITVTNSIYIKAGTATQLLFRDDLGAGRHIVINPITGQIVGSSGTIISSGSISMGNGWYRYYMTYVTDSVNVRNWVRNDTAGTLTYYTWGAQFNIGSLQPYYTTSVKNLLGYSQNFENAAWTKSNSSVLTNLLTYSEQFDNAFWNKVTCSVLTNTVNSPDGTATADKIVEGTGSVNPYIAQDISVNASATYTFSCYAKQDSLSQKRYLMLLFPSTNFGANVRILVDLSNGSKTEINSPIATSVTSIGNQWYRISVTATAVVTGTAGLQIRLTSQVDGSLVAYTGDGTSGIYIWGAQLNIGSLRPYYTTSVKNLLGYSQNFENAAWAKSNSTIDATPVMGPLGFLGAEKLIENTVNAPHYIRQFPSITTPVAFSVYAKAGERTKFQLDCYDATNGTRNAVFNLVSGTVETILGAGVSANIIALSNGWYRCCMILPTSATGGDCKIALYTTSNSYLGDGTSGIYIFGAQLSDSASLDPYVYNFGAAPTSSAYYGPRFDYDPVTLAPKGLLIEEARTNLLTYSSEFNNNAVWTIGVGLTVTPNTAISPDGSQNADTITPNGAGAIASIYYDNITVTASTSYTFSIYVKLGTLAASDYKIAVYNVTGSAFIALDVTPTQVPNTTGWTRISYTFTTPVGCISARVYPYRSSATVNATMYLYGAQVEAGSFPTSYIPTTSAQVTRTADNASMVGTNFSSWYNQSEGTVVYSSTCLGQVSDFPTLWWADDSTLVNYLGQYYYTSIMGVAQRANNINYGDVNTVGSSINPLVINKSAYSYKTNDSALSANGSALTGIAVDNTLTLPTLSRFNIGSKGGAGYLNGHIQSFKYFNKRLLNSYLQSLTQ